MTMAITVPPCIGGLCLWQQQDHLEAVVLTTGLVKWWPTPCLVAYVNKIGQEVQGMRGLAWVMLSHPNSPPKEDGCVQNPLACRYVHRPRDAVKHQEMYYLYSCNMFFRAWKVNPGLYPRSVQGALMWTETETRLRVKSVHKERNENCPFTSSYSNSVQAFSRLEMIGIGQNVARDHTNHVYRCLDLPA